MKKAILLTVTFLCLFFIGKATHNVGGEITVKQTGTLEYEATIHTYTIASSIPADRDSLNICWGDGVCEWVARDTSYLVGNNLKYNRYPKIHTYSSQNTYTISMTDPNRIGGILNIPISSNIPFHIETTIVVNDLQNSTPIIKNPISDLAYVGQVYQHNPIAFDCDGDSLTYEFNIPLQGIGSPIPNFSLPDQIFVSLDNILEINSENGTITWSVPQQAGLYTIAIKISEFRGDNLLSTTIRDFQISVLPDFNLSPEITTNLLAEQMTLSVGDTLNFDVTGVDPSGENLLLQCSGQPFLLNHPPTFDAPTDFQDGPITTNFDWVITDDHVLFSPHYIVFRLEERGENSVEGLTKYKVIKVSINDSPTNTDDLFENLEYKIFPNPITEGILNVKFNDDFLGEKIIWQVFSLDGKLLLENLMNIYELQQTIDLQGLIKGNYIFTVSSATNSISNIITIN